MGVSAHTWLITRENKSFISILSDYVLIHVKGASAGTRSPRRTGIASLLEFTRLGKGSKYRTVYLTRQSAALVRKAMEHYGRKTGPVFMNKAGGRITDSA